MMSCVFHWVKLTFSVHINHQISSWWSRTGAFRNIRPGTPCSNFWPLRTIIAGKSSPHYTVRDSMFELDHCGRPLWVTPVHDIRPRRTCEEVDHCGPRLRTRLVRNMHLDQDFTFWFLGQPRFVGLTMLVYRDL